MSSSYGSDIDRAAGQTPYRVGRVECTNCPGSCCGPKAPRDSDEGSGFGGGGHLAPSEGIDQPEGHNGRTEGSRRADYQAGGDGCIQFITAMSGLFSY